MTDPTRFDLLRSGSTYLRDWRLDKDSRWLAIEEAAYWFASWNHGGQWSNLYRALCASQFRPPRLASGPSCEIAAELVKHFEGGES